MASLTTLSNTATPNGASFGIVLWLFIISWPIYTSAYCVSLIVPSILLPLGMPHSDIFMYFFSDFLDPLAHYGFSVFICVINQNLGLNSPYSVSQIRITGQCWYPKHCVAIQRAGLCWTWKGLRFSWKAKEYFHGNSQSQRYKRSQLLLRPSKVSGRGFTCPGGIKVALTVTSLFVYQFILFSPTSWVYSPSDQTPRAWPWEATTQHLTPMGIEQCNWSLGQKVRGQGREPSW